MKKVYALNDLDCAVCAQKMQDAIAKLDGVLDAEVSFIKQKLTIETADDIDIDDLMKKVKKTIRKVEPDCEVVM
ncbi:MAG: heavy-metal-associated domain-containing protein [Clostridia bacterium]|nr:heavy-metal-associated domain-containing protein [Clostridia bacterium]